MVEGLMQRSFQGGVLILVIIAVRILWLDRLPKRTFPVLWSLALIRLLLPFSFSSAFSLYTLLQTAQSRAMPEQYPARMWEGVTLTGSQPAWTMVRDLALGQEPAAVAEGGMRAIGAIWCAGAVAMALFFAAAYVRSLWQFRQAVPVEDGRVQRWLEECVEGRRGCIGRVSVRRWDRIQAPLTYGCLHPVILLPGRALESSGQDLRYILQHELMHICHCDAAFKLAMVASLCIHWFNPTVWVMCGLMNRDMELACDEGVLRRFGEEARAGYAMTLIGMEEKKRVLLSLYNGFSKSAIEERVSLIMKYKKIKHAAVMASLMLVAGTALVFATSARTAQARPDSSQDAEGGLADQAYGSRAAGLPLDPPVGTPGTDGRGEEISAGNGTLSGEGLTGTGSQGMSGAGSGMEARPEESLAGDQAVVGESAEGTRPAQEYTLRYMQEGMLQEEAACLHRGQGYGLLIPVEGWKSGGSDEWVWESNEQVRFWVADYGGNTWEQALDILEQEGYAGAEAYDVLRKEEDGAIFHVRLSGSGNRIMGIHYAYPAVPEYEEGFGIILSAIAANFGTVQEEPGLSEDGRMLERLAMAFWEAYLAGDAARLEPYLTAGYAGDVETFPDGVDGHVAAEAQLLAVKGLDAEEPAEGVPDEEEKATVWVEFRPWEGADALEYLTIMAVREGDGWKVSGYGLER